MNELIQTAYQSAATYDRWLETRRQLTFHDWFWIVYVPSHFEVSNRPRNRQGRRQKRN